MGLMKTSGTELLYSSEAAIKQQLKLLVEVEAKNYTRSLRWSVSERMLTE